MENYISIHDKPSKRAALATFPKMIPNRADHPNAAYVDLIRKELEQWDVPVQVIWSDGDMAWKPDEGARIARCLPDGDFYLVQNAGHFLQEDAGKEVAECMVDFLRHRVDRSKPMQDQAR